MAVPSTISSHAEQRLTVEPHDWTAWSALVGAWSTLASACEHTTFFLTPESVTTWLSAFGDALRPKVLVFKTSSGAIAGACIIVRRVERKGPFFVRRVYLNTAGEADSDSPCIEYNELLCGPGHEYAMARALRDYLDDTRDQEPWDEFHAPGMLDGKSLDAVRRVWRDTRELDDVKASYYVDLDELRSSGKDIVEKVASRERSRIRQNLRKYSDIGELAIEPARDVAEALQYLDALAALHQRTWIERGRSGAFASTVFCNYHRQLITQSLPLGRIELLHLRAGDTTVGYHYNFLFGGRTYFYQCGYDYALGDKLSPGVIVHALAIRRALESGGVDYEFMAGDVEYKRRLATHSRQMHWIAWQAPTLKMRTFEIARQTRRAVRDRVKDFTVASRASLSSLVMQVRGQD